MKTILVIIALAAFLYWLVVLRHGRLDFWKIASNYPDKAYDFFAANDCWKVFEDGLPDDYQAFVPKELWTGPFRLRVPKLGNKLIHIFGRHPDFEDSQNDFMKKVGRP